MEMASQGQKLFAARLAIGLAQGLALYLLYRANDAKIWPATQGLVFGPLLFAWLFAPVLLTLSLGAMPWRRAFIWGAATASIIAVLAFFDIWIAWPLDWVYGNPPHWQPHIIPSSQLFIFGGGGLFIAHALVTGGNADHRFKASYSTHFDVAWKLAVQLALAGLFVGAFWLLLWLGAGLFQLIKLDFFQKLIRHEWFAIPATTLAAAGALHLTDIRPALVQGARTLLLTLLSWLLPLITLIVAGFVASLPFTGLAALWGIGHATALLLTAAAALIVLINAAHQDGAAERMPPRALRLSGTIAAILIFPLAAIAAYALFLRVQQYGWTVDRVTVAAILAVALSYAGGYARAALSGGPWLQQIESWNFYVSLLTLAILVALFTPIVSPVRISVADQVARLNSGKITQEKFDYSYLRWHGGRYGRDALTVLSKSNDPRAKKLALDALRETNRYVVRNAAPLLADKLTVYPQGQKLPESFVRMDWSKEARSWLRPVCPVERCEAILADLDGDRQPEVMLVTSAISMAEVFHGDPDGSWREIGSIRLPPQCPAILEALRQGRFDARPPAVRWNDLQFAGTRLRLQQSDPNETPPECPK